MTWECIAVTHDDYQIFLESIRKSRDPNEKALNKRINDQVMPIIERRVEAQRQKVAKKQRELENLQKMANAKRSSRLAGKQEARKAEEDAAEAERKRLADLEMAHKEQQRQRKLEDVSISARLEHERNTDGRRLANRACLPENNALKNVRSSVSYTKRNFASWRTIRRTLKWVWIQRAASLSAT